jgi:PAS domain S-box-containing protein
MQEKNNLLKRNFQELIDLIPDLVLIINKEGIVLAANKAISTIAGVQTKKLVGYSVDQMKVFDEKTRSFFQKQLEKRMKKEELEDYKIQFLVNNENRYFAVKGNKINYFGQIAVLVVFHETTTTRKKLSQSLGKIEKIDGQGTFRDVTERKVMEQALQKSEEKFRGIASSVRDAIIMVDEEAKVTFWNPTAEQTFGYSNLEAIGKIIHELVVPNSLCKEGKERIDASVKIFSETGTGYFTIGNVELTGRRKDGSEFPAELSISPIMLAGKWNAVGVVKDITNRKKAEAKTREAEQRYHALFNQAPLGVSVIDPQEATFVEFNDIAHMQLGYSREEFCKLRIFDVEANESPDETRLHLAEMLRDGGGEFETTHRTKKGEIRNILATTKPIELPGKTLLNAIFHDITEIKKTQNELAKYSQKLEELVEKRTEELKQTQAKLVKSERLAAIGELAGMIGHDLRNPLTGIKNSAYFLKKKGKTIREAQAIEMIETIDKCVDYSNKIVNDLLDYSREIRLELHECSLSKLLTESLAMANVPEKIEIVNQLQNDVVLKVDADKIERVFVNLIKNSVEAMQNVGTLTIDDKIVDGSLEISFTDTGPGIPDEILPKLFAPLFTTKAKGMGFGLAICKRIIEAHGGTIIVKTSNGKGTTFQIIIPIETKLEIEVKTFD